MEPATYRCPSDDGPQAQTTLRHICLGFPPVTASPRGFFGRGDGPASAARTGSRVRSLISTEYARRASISEFMTGRSYSHNNALSHLCTIFPAV